MEVERLDEFIADPVGKFGIDIMSAAILTLMISL